MCICAMTHLLLDATTFLSHVSQKHLLLGILTLLLPGFLLLFLPLFFFLQWRLYETVTGGRNAPPVRLVPPTAPPMLTAKSAA